MTMIDTTPAAPTPISETPAHTSEAFVQRLLDAVLGTLDVQAAYLGDRLGYYRLLAEHDEGLTSDELATRSGTAERYTREWLEQQAVTGFLVASQDPDAMTRRYVLPLGHRAPLTDELSLDHVLPLARLVAGLGKHADALLHAYRTGDGVSWAQQGDDARQAQAAANRPMFLHRLGSTYLASVPDLDAALRAGGRVADIGCGLGWSSIGIALSYPDATVDGYDVDVPSVEAARRNAHEAGLGDRVRFHVADAAVPPVQAGPYDVVTAFECIHDLSDPVGVLSTMRNLAGRDGIVLIMDERVAEVFTAPGDNIERLMYGYSLLCCLPDGMSHQPSATTGTVMRPETLRRYAADAGFAQTEILDIHDDFFRFYRLRQP
jgi:2-polyprenyl-3-methyl-5-hydroxy-6-metoxy-1,4-benzoquinol methylase